jgi:hypothetical protein
MKFEDDLATFRLRALPPEDGLEVVEKLLTTSILAANRTALRAVKRSGVAHDLGVMG